MRSPFLFACLAVALCVGGCASPKRSAVHYSPPSVAPVREKISSAQGSVANAITLAGAAKTAIARATELLAAPADQLSVPDLQEALGEASGKVDALTTQLGSALGALGEAQVRIDALETKVSTQAAQLNTAIDEKNAAITWGDAAVSKYHRLKFFICLLAAAAAGLLVFQFRGLLVYLGPWGLAAYVVVPGLVFTALWIRL